MDHSLLSVVTLKMAEDISLSELLASPSTSDEAISFLANACKKLAAEHATLDDCDQELEVELQRINLSIDNRIRQEAFYRIKERRQTLQRSRIPA